MKNLTKKESRLKTFNIYILYNVYLNKTMHLPKSEKQMDKKGEKSTNKNKTMTNKKIVMFLQ